MLKNKYQRMNKTEKKLVRENYYKTNDGKIMHNRLTRILIISILCFIYSLYLLIDNIINTSTIWMYIFAISIFIAALIFLIGYIKIRVKSFNTYTLKK